MIRTYPFTTPANYTFDTNNCEVADGKGRPTNIIDVYKAAYNATFFANYETDINGLWGNGSLIGTPTGGAAVSGGKLDLKAWGKYVSYDAVGNADSLQQGCIEIEVIPDWSGSGANRTIVCISKADGDQKNRIQIMQWNNGQIKVTMVDKDGAVIEDQLLSVWNPIQGQPYTFSLDWDITAGQTILRINGTQHGITMTGTGLRDSNIGLLRIGADFNGNNPVNAEINNFLIFSTIQHVADYTPDWSVVPETLYSKDNPTIEINETIRTEKRNGLSGTEIKTGSDEIKYIIKNGTKWYWYDGADIVEADGTYAQSNTLAEWQVVFPGWTSAASILAKFKMFFHSTDGSTRPEVDVLNVDYDFYGETPDTINKCIVWAYQKETDGDIRQDKIKVYLENDVVQYKDNITLRREKYTVTPDENGYWEIELTETVNMEGTQKYVFEIGNKVFKKSVPNEESKGFYEL